MNRAKCKAQCIPITEYRVKMAGKKSPNRSHDPKYNLVPKEESHSRHKLRSTFIEDIRSEEF